MSRNAGAEPQSGRMVVAGGRVYTPSGPVQADVAVEDGRVVAVGPHLPAPEDAEVIDAAGCLVTPGLVDLHVHAFKYGHHIGLDVDELAPRTGTTTFVDGGSVGALQFVAFRRFVVDATEANLFAYLNVSAIGQTTSGLKGLDFHDNDHRALIHLPLAEEMIEAHPDVIRGIKVRVYTGMKDLYALEQARILADRVGLPIMVHIGPAPPDVSDTLALLREGDMFTHPYHGGADTILDANGRIRPEFLDARERGVEVDLGMDRFHCDLTVMRRAFDQGYYPTYVSTDLTLTNVDSITFDLPTTISKCVSCGMSLDDALGRATAAPARKIGSHSVTGRLEPGAVADLAIFRWEEGEEPLVDFFGNAIRGARRLGSVATVLRSRVLPHRTTDVALLKNSERAVPWSNYA